MIRVDVDNRCDEFDSYRAARVKSLFNADSGANVRVRADLDIEDDGWRIGVVVGPSGSGKSTIGRSLWGGAAFYDAPWPTNAPIVDVIGPGGDFNEITGALAAVGLGDVPSWLRPYAVLSNGERFRADLARIVAERPERVVVDEFTSVVDRQIARIGAGAFAKAWRRGTGQAVLLTCHYDVLEWLQPDWIWDTRDHLFTRGWDQQRPRIDVEIRTGGWELWPLFKPHHYLEAGPMAGAVTYVGFVDGEPVIHLGVGSANAGGRVEARACRMVVMPEWQGAGIGTRFLNHVCDLYLRGEGHLGARPMTTAFHTSHPQLCAALRRDKRWTQMSAALHGVNRGKSRAAMGKSRAAMGKSRAFDAGYGGHFRAIQGFRYVGTAEERAAAKATTKAAR